MSHLTVQELVERTTRRKALGLIPDYSKREVKPPVAACGWKGEPAGPKGWHLCDHEDEPLGMVVCACKGYGPRCPGYSTLPARTPAPAGPSPAPTPPAGPG